MCSIDYNRPWGGGGGRDMHLNKAVQRQSKGSPSSERETRNIFKPKTILVCLTSRGRRGLDLSWAWAEPSDNILLCKVLPVSGVRRRIRPRRLHPPPGRWPRRSKIR